MQSRLRITRSIIWTSLGLVGLSVTSLGQFTTTGPFTGTHQDGFETQDTSSGPFPPCVVDRTFSDNADLCCPNGSAHITGGWGFGCSIQEHSGNNLFGSTGGVSIFTFDGTATRFGGYFGTNNPSQDHGVINFFDATGALLHSDTITAPNDCTWTWNGWDSGGLLIKSIEVWSNYGSGGQFGGWMMMDDLEVDLSGGGNTGTSYCDGSTGNCPGGAVGAVGQGCPNSNPNGNGGLLVDTGNAQFSNDTYGFQVTDGAPSKPGIMIQGASAISYPTGNPTVGNSAGLFCVAPQQRGKITFTDTAGAVVVVEFQIGVAFGAGAQPAGSTTYYQYWQRDPNNPNANGGPGSGNFNFTNAVETNWVN